jgi:hypothetical protein
VSRGGGRADHDPLARDSAKYRPHRPHHPHAVPMGFWRAIQLLAIAREWRVSTAPDLLGLLVFRILFDDRGRCGRYVNDLYGYIGVVRVYEGCCQVISRR